jgi:phosphoribosylanthranilate isomerase
MIVQIAGVKSLEETEMIIDCGADMIGHPLVLDYHKPDLSKNELKEIIRLTKDRITHVMITYQTMASEIIELMEYVGCDWVQLHGKIELDEVKKLHLVGKNIIKSLIVKQDNAEELRKEIDEYSDYVDYFITDTFDQETGASGATGKTHNWDLSAELVQYSNKPIILAGGLTPDNVAEAIAKVNPAGVDAHTGLEDENGNKDEMKVREFA